MLATLVLMIFLRCKRRKLQLRSKKRGNGRFKEKGGGWGIKKGFYKLELKDENTTQGFAN